MEQEVLPGLVDQFETRTAVEKERFDVLIQVEQNVQERMRTFAQLCGGEYVPPTREDLIQKFRSVLSLNQQVKAKETAEGMVAPSYFYQKDQPNPAIEAYNLSGLHGYIRFPRTEVECETQRLYRGCVYDPHVRQVAGLARVNGIEVGDLFAYRSGDMTLDQLVAKASNPLDKQSLIMYLDDLRKFAQTSGLSEWDALKQEHVRFTPNAKGLGLWVSCAHDPEKIYNYATLEPDQRWGSFLRGKVDAMRMEAVTILDVPTSEVVNYSNEDGVFGEIKHQYMRAIVPAVAGMERVTRDIIRVEIGLT